MGKVAGIGCLGIIAIFALIWTVVGVMMIFAPTPEAPRYLGFFALALEVAVFAGILAAATQDPVIRSRSIGTIVGAVVTIFVCVGMNMNSKPASQVAQAASTDAPVVADAPTDPPVTAEPTPNEHDAREKVHEYWEPVMTGFASANVLLQGAAYSVSQGDSVQAQQYLKEASEWLDRVNGAVSSNVPDGDDWSAISMHLGEAAQQERNGVNEAEDALDQGSSKKWADAIDDAKEAGDQLADQTHLARVWYITHGGSGADLDDEQTATKAVDSMLSALAGSK